MNLNFIEFAILFVMYLPVFVSLRAIPMSMLDLDVRFEITIQCMKIIMYISSLTIIFGGLGWLVNKIFKTDIIKYY